MVFNYLESTALSKPSVVKLTLNPRPPSYVEVSLEQAIAASTPAFTAGIGMVMLRRREKWRVILALIPVIGGAFISAGGEPTLHFVGMACVFGSIVMRATKACLQELLLAGETEQLDSLNLLRWMSALSMATLLPVKRQGRTSAITQHNQPPHHL